MSVLLSRLLGVGTAAALLAATASCGSSDSASTAPPPAGPVTTAPSSATTPSVSGDFAGTVDLGDGRGVYLECHGSGSPTVVLLSGFGNAGDIWFLTEDRPPAVAPAIAGLTRVCTYDRPGSYVSSKAVGDEVVPLGEFAPARGTAVAVPRVAAAAVVADLKALLTVAGVQGPYVLAGHSLGGLFANLYARTHPDDVAGLVFVDATSPQLTERVPAKLLSPLLVDQLARAPSVIPGYVNETYDFDRSVDQLLAAPPVPEVPAIVLVAGQAQSVPTPPPGITTSDIDELFRQGRQAQRDFAASIGAQVVPVPDSSHYIQVMRPDTVIAAIREVIDSAAASPR